MKQHLPSNSYQLLFIIFCLLISIPVIVSYFHQGYFPTHDGEWAVVRLSDMYRTLRDLQFPARYSDYLNFSYGYPLFNFTYPFPYYLGFLIHLFKINFVSTIKIIFAGSVVFSAIGMYLLSSAFWKNKIAGIISSVLYIYLPYRLVDLYVRGSIGESVSFALFPFILYFLYKTSQKKSYVFTIIASFFYALLVLTHNIMAVEFSPIVVLFAFVLFLYNKTLLRQLILFFVLSICLSAFFWLPALAEKHNIALSAIPIADRSLYFVNVQQLLFSGWGYGTPTAKDPFTYQIGIPQILIFIIAILYVVWSFFKKKRNTVEITFSSLLFLFLIFYLFLLFSPSLVVWQHLPLFTEINYPWTLLGCIGFVIALLSGSLVAMPFGKYIGVAATIFAIVLYLPNAHPQYYVDRGDSFYVTNQATTTSSDELMPLWMKQKPTHQWTQKVTLKNGTVSNIIQNSRKIQFTASAPQDTTVIVNTIYYPGWIATVNGRAVAISYTNPMGIMEIPITKGTNTVLLKFTETPLRLFADILSLVSLVGAVLLIIFRKKL